MKLAILSDIHGNLPALEAVTEHLQGWQPDQILVNGDIVNRGPLPHHCWDFIQAQDWVTTCGNHEEFVLNWSTSPQVPEDDPRYPIYGSSRWTCRRLNGKLSALRALPDVVSLESPGGEVRLTHASMRGNRDGIYLSTTDAELREQITPPPAVFLTAHTHDPLIRGLDGTLVINSGSVGAPFDGDTRASYAKLAWCEGAWHAWIERVPYDRDRARDDFHTSGYLSESGPLTRIFLYEWEYARPCISRWTRTYEQAYLQGEISLEASVDEFLAGRP